MDSGRKRKYKLLIVYIIFVIAFILVLQYVFLSPLGPQELPYSQFLQDLDEGKVEQATIGESEIKWKRIDSEEWMVATRVPGVDDAEVIERLHQNGAEFSGEVTSPFWSNILSWVIPLVFFALIWYFLILRMGSGQQFMSLGRSGAKLYDKGSVEVNFDNVAVSKLNDNVLSMTQ